MAVNNFEQISKLLNFTSKEEFYLLQIIHRKKDGLTQFDTKENFSAKTIKSYYISSVEYLENKMPEIIQLCQIFNARAYINLNKKSYKQVALKSLEELAKGIYAENYSCIKSLLDSSCGQTGACDKNKTWLVDIDGNSLMCNDIESIIDQCEPVGNKTVALIPTIHGFHLITKPFNKKAFRIKCPIQIDIHDNNPTLLYGN